MPHHFLMKTCNTRETVIPLTYNFEALLLLISEKYTTYILGKERKVIRDHTKHSGEQKITCQ
jgi:hypothetical protein